MWRAVAVTSLFLVMTVVLCVASFRGYALGTFVIAPLCAGCLAATLSRRWGEASTSQSIRILALSLLCTAATLIAFAFEGLICILMAAPLAFCLGLAGICITAALQRVARRGMIVPLLLVSPTVSFTETLFTTDQPWIPVETTVEIQAPPSVVWRHVIEFSELPPAREWFFSAGLAYPVRARIEGRGVGAIRYCEFSTGPFVEPIQIWDEPRLLKFAVTSSPAPMRELSPFDIHPPHLDGYFESRQGQFLLEPLPGGRTRLRGTTWYALRIRPLLYWRQWSDTIIHRIHWRVLHHIRTLAEAEAHPSSSIDRGQSDPNSRDRDRSANNLPPVWQRAQ